MDVKLFQKTQRDLASTINFVIDRYWEDEINEDKMTDIIQRLYDNNESKFAKDGRYTTILRQQCGKRRLEVISKILDLQL
jgi:uncharacterized protein (TIGR04540 family)